MQKNPLFSLATALTRGGRLAILIYHRVLAEPDPFFANTVNVRAFAAQMRTLKRYFNVLSLNEAMAAKEAQRLPPRAVCISFDDGYADNATQAMPVLAELGLPATFFIATDFIDGGRMWLDQVVESIRAYNKQHIDLRDYGFGQYSTQTDAEKLQLLLDVLPRLRYMNIEERNAKVAALCDTYGHGSDHELMMTSAQLKTMDQAGMTLGAHTAGHPNLALLDEASARAQIQTSKQKLEQLLGKDVDYFAYPFGKCGKDFLPDQARLVQELGFRAAVTTDTGVADYQCNPFLLPRFTPWDKNPHRFALRLAMHFAQAPQRETALQ